MKVVDRKTFLSMPPGTLYAKFGGVPTVENTIDLGSLFIKESNRGSADWYATAIPEWPEHQDTDGLLDVCQRLIAGADLPPDMESSTSDGLYDDGQLFAVLTESDVDALIERLHRAKAEAFPRVTT